MPNPPPNGSLPSPQIAYSQWMQACANAGWHNPTPDRHPPELVGRQQVVRAYDQQGRIVGGVLAADGRQAAEVIAELLAKPEMELVHPRNVGYGCYNFAVRATG